MTCAGRIGQQARRTCRRPSTVATGVGDTAHERNGSLMTQHHQAAVQAAPAPTMAAWIGAWRTEGEVLGEDGRTVVATLAGSDVPGGARADGRPPRRRRDRRRTHPRSGDLRALRRRARRLSHEGLRRPRWCRASIAVVRNGVWTSRAGPATPRSRWPRTACSRCSDAHAIRARAAPRCEPLPCHSSSSGW